MVELEGVVIVLVELGVVEQRHAAVLAVLNDGDSVVEVARWFGARRRTPTIGDAAAEVVTFRAPPVFKERIKARAQADHTSESQVIRDALDAYLAQQPKPLPRRPC